MSFLYEKVLMIGPGGNKGGIASVINTYRENYKGIHFISSYPETKTSYRLIHFISCIAQMLNALHHKKGIRIIHLHVASKGSFLRKSILLVLAKIYGRAIVLHMHGGAFHNFYEGVYLKQAYIRKIMGMSNAIIALSEEWKAFYSETLKLENVWAIGNPVNQIACKKKSKTSGEIELLFLGKICEEKGIFRLIREISQNEDFKENKIKLTIAGVGETKRMEEEIRLTGNPNQIQYIGWVEGEEKNSAICNADIFILPSLFEGLPVSIIECMMCRKPIIATNVGGIPTLVTHGYNGWLYDPNNIGAFHKIIHDVVANQHLLEEYGIHSYERSQDFSPYKIEEKLSDLYQNIAASI